ncbi:MAG: lysophospholipid acyltransferase family protein [Pseudomonadota bacterium]|nr:lysophospholipid acyltransferase family protein [Pseudomonadota bacterium]
MRFGVKLCLAWLRITCNITYRIHGFSKLNPEQPSIILSRHESTWEALAFHAIFPLQINLVKKELKKIPFFGFILTTINSIMIDRNKGFNAIKKIKLEGKKAIKDGFWVVIFPGGTRVLPGESSNINSGGAILAKQENVPIYLITHNAGTVWPKGTFIKQPGIIDLHINVIEQPEVKDISTINRETEEWFQSKQHLTLNTCIASEEIVYPITDP